jgi:hypothetical protein
LGGLVFSPSGNVRKAFLLGQRARVTGGFIGIGHGLGQTQTT